MKFSIVTPSYNQGRFLPDCVESVLSQLDASRERRNPDDCICRLGKSREAQPGWPQGNPSADAAEGAIKGAKHGPLALQGQGESESATPCFTIEHIVTDAGSTDETLDVLKRYPHLRWTSEPDEGMSDGINKGFLKATGDWVMWLNCDDYLLPVALAKVANFIISHPDADVVHGDCIYVREDKFPIRRKYDTPVDEWDFLFVGCCIPSTATFYRREIIESGHLLDITYRNCMDWEYYLRLTRLGYRFGYIPEALAGFRWHEESTTQTHWQRMIDEGLRAQREHIASRGLPDLLKNAIALKALRKIFQLRRVFKRVLAHGRIW